MTDSKARTLLIVVSYNNFSLTEQCLLALKNQDVDVDVVLWDNASSDNTQEQIKQRSEEFGLYKYFLSPKNVMWTPAINRGLELGYDPARHRYIGWLNNDAIVTDSSVVRRLEECLDDPTCGIVAPMMPRVGGPQEPNQYIGSPPIDGCQRVTYVLGAFAMLRANVWQEVGPQDESLPLGADDHDYCIRIKDLGYQVWIARNLTIEHGGHASAGSVEGQSNWNKWGAISWKAFNEKWDMYYATEEEAIKCHWGGVYHEGWDMGTGRLDADKKAEILAQRGNVQ